MTIKNFLSAYSKNFDKKDLEIFLEKILNCDKNFLFLNEEFSLTKKNFSDLNKFLEEKKAWYSVASIIWEKDFYWRSFFINKNVLVPREETEDLVTYIKGKNLDFWNKNILDIWTWSWIIPITLNLEFNSMWDYYACDISDKALKVANKNSKNFWTKINFFKSDLLKNIPKKINDKFEKEWIFLITANLPYVENKFKTDKNVNFKNWISKEPDLALYSWDDWLDLYRELFEKLSVVDNNIKFKYLIMEMWIWQTDIVASLYSSLWKTEIYYDLGWNKRWVFVESF